MFFRIIIFFFFFTSYFIVKSENINLINQADSLFESKKYTEAFELYAQVYEEGSASAAMLIKMAFIKEGLGDYTSALYYLDHYYKKTSNKRVLEKMYELANENNLEGFEFSDYKFAINTIAKYRTRLIFGLLGLAMFVFALMMAKRTNGTRAIPWIACQVVILIPALLILNGFFGDSEAIVGNDQTIAMDGPSAASEPLELIAKGTKVKVIDANEIWTKIQINETEAYVRSNRLLELF
ncbi:MAG: hypothetical protein JXR03_08260 [Cyclobacteriaceae bacterium]